MKTEKRECPHCHGSLERYEDPKAVDMIEELRDLKIEKHWYGFRPGSDNNKPTVKIDESFDNLIINSGHHRYGITMAPNTIPLVIDYVFG